MASFASATAQKTGEKIKIPAKTVVKLGVSKSVKDLVLGGK
jgi:nucleoid DNA-binding protein